MNAQSSHRPSGLTAVGALPWGSHFCQFYGGAEDLVDSLVPFFKAGLEANEKCLWVTSTPLRAEDARIALRQAVPDLDRRVEAKQIEIVDHDDWYLRTGRQNASDTLQGWVEREQCALSEGFDGLRLTGNTYWVERNDWQGFADYESRVSDTFRGHRIIGLCSYCLGRCDPGDILDVVRNHQFAVVRRNGDWELLERSAHVRATQELEAVNRELERRVAERTQQLERAVKARDEFLSVASHELKTPITSLQLYVQGLQRARAQGKVTEADLTVRLERVLRQCNKLEKLVNDLLDVSRTESTTPPPLQREQLDLAALVQDAVERFSEELSRARCAVRVEASEPAWGRFDAMRIEQAVTNLLQNAVRHAAGANVQISVLPLPEHVRLVVRDTGPGIDPADHERIFQRFAQASGPRAFAGGFGLGLWIVRQVAEAHGGSVTVDSRRGFGAAFTLVLPRN